MKRVALTDGSRKWFNIETAEKFNEDTRWNGNNHISKATGSPWHHEVLWRTKSGRWVLNCWSNFQGSLETYEEIGNQDAAWWFMKNEYNDKEIPLELLPLLEKSIKACEI